jgi:GNAT superfamily N-acetyltransferase
VDYRKNMSIIGLTSRGGHKDIMAIASYVPAEQGRAEVAFVVRDDFQKQGVGSHLLEILEKIARQNDYQGFTASVLLENRAMLQVFRKRYPNMKVKAMSNEAVIDMDFEDRGPRE